MYSTCPSREVDHFLGWTASRSGTVDFAVFRQLPRRNSIGLFGVSLLVHPQLQVQTPALPQRVSACCISLTAT